MGGAGRLAHSGGMKTSPTMRTPIVLALLVLGLGLGLLAPAAYAKGGGGVKPPAPTLPADWPAVVPVPTGTIVGSTGASPSWTVQVLVNQGYPDVVRSVTALYTSAGLTQAADGTLVFANPTYRVTVVGQNHDHSASQTDVVVWLQLL